MEIRRLYQIFLKSSGICTDTRHITDNCLFFALKGDKFDGNLFAQEALDKGASYAVVDDEKHHKHTGETILVRNGLIALQELAQLHRKTLGIPIIALTGSNGKTTTKELIYAVLSKRFNATATRGNLNNHIGVPLTLLSMTSKTDIGIVEMGANHLGEIKMLSAIALPDYGYITNFGKAHLEGFGNLQGVIKGKTELYGFLKTNNKTAFINADDSQQVELSDKINRITFGTQNRDFNIKRLDSPNTLRVQFENTEIQSQLTGAYNFSNIAAAIAIGAYFKVPLTQIKQGIEGYIPSNNRSQILTKGTNTILMDAYNANPTSMLAALQNFKELPGKYKIVYLGDMFELGENAADEHQKIMDFVDKNNFDQAHLVGDNFYSTTHAGTAIDTYRTYGELAEKIRAHPPQNATILIKGSRGMALERILDLL